MEKTQSLFEFAILYHKKSGAEVIAKPELILAASEEEVGIIAARKIPEKYLKSLKKVEVLVRPF